MHQKTLLRLLLGALFGLFIAIGPAQAGKAGATCANPKPVSLPIALNGAANACWVTSGTIDSVVSQGVDTFTINGVSYANQASSQMPARINGNYTIRYVAKLNWAQLQINGSNAGSAAGLKSLASFPIGVAVNAGFEANSFLSSSTSAQQQSVVLPNFSQLTAGNIMKMGYLHPTETSFTFGQADELVAFAAANGMGLHGHTLIWHADYQVPAFMKNYSGDFAAMLKNHVQTIVSHFRGKVASWDVVNEALADDGEPTVGNNLRSTVFSQRMGIDFIDQAFINARAADPQVDLFYNDYNLEAAWQKTWNMLALVDGMRSRGVPITGVGFQMHVGIDWPSISAIEASLKAVADRGLKVKITELDVSLKSAYTSFTPEAADRQKQRYHDIVAAYLRAVPPAQRAGITVWGVWDTNSWINEPTRPDWPLLFDANFNAKPALQGFKDALQGR
jgi:endo-1,4-beta-xylanase